MTNSDPIKTVTMTPSSHKEGVKISTDVLYLNELPLALDKMKWTVSAKVMRRWFATEPAWAMPQTWRSGYYDLEHTQIIDYRKLPASQVDNQIVKMNWLLNFERVLPTFEYLCQHWNTPKGIERLKNIQLKNAGWQQGKKIKIGSISNSAMELESTCQINAQPIGAYEDTFDDLYGAIFKATLKLALIGKTARSWLTKQDVFEIEKIGVYLRDTYDFNVEGIDDNLYGLGVWSKERLLTKKETAEFRVTPNNLLREKFNGFVFVQNHDFRRWQKKNNSGGDFFVFSDVMWIEPNIEYVIL
jgi:hypothetical protein